MAVVHTVGNVNYLSRLPWKTSLTHGEFLVVEVADSDPLVVARGRLAEVEDAVARRRVPVGQEAELGSGQTWVHIHNEMSRFCSAGQR